MDTFKCERKVISKFTLETEKLIYSLCLQTEPTKKKKKKKDLG